MKNSVRPAGASSGHQLSEALRRAREHIVQVSGVQAYALRLARSPGSVNDRDVVRIRSRNRLVTKAVSGSVLSDGLLKENSRRRLSAALCDRLAGRCIAYKPQPRLAGSQH